MLWANVMPTSLRPILCIVRNPCSQGVNLGLAKERLSSQGAVAHTESSLFFSPVFFPFFFASDPRLSGRSARSSLWGSFALGARLTLWCRLMQRTVARVPQLASYCTRNETKRIKEIQRHIKITNILTNAPRPHPRWASHRQPRARNLTATKGEVKFISRTP